MTTPAGIILEPFGSQNRAEATRLVDRVFLSQSPIERLSLRVFQTRWEWLFRLGGFEEARFWVAMRDGAALGIVGLYTQSQDHHEANWLGWFCVAPEARGLHIGQFLLDHAVAEAKVTGRRFLRLYTSTDLNERSAQTVYQRNGFRVVRRYRPLLWRMACSPMELLHRERDLAVTAA
jgi:GNAT superfamily N-acetyltransferase